MKQAISSIKDTIKQQVAESREIRKRIRDACPKGHEHRYGDDQIRYHYAKDRAVLSALSQSASSVMPVLPTASTLCLREAESESGASRLNPK